MAEYSTKLNDTPQVAYLTNDHLGSPRINTDENGAVASRHDYRPYGEQITERTHAHYVNDAIRKQFTGYERDGGMDLDYAQARSYAFGLGRFTVPDNFFADSDQRTPQSWNLYIYVRNKPSISIDPTGMMTDFIDRQTGQRTHIDDFKDQVITASTKAIKGFVDAWNRGNSDPAYREAYYRDLARFERSWHNLHLTVAEFDRLAQAVYAESSGSVNEAWGIVNVLENRAAADGTDLITQVSDAPGYGVYGVRDARYFTESGPDAEQKRRNTHRGIAGGIPGGDITNGAYYWHGRDLGQAGSGAYRGFYLVGLRFSSQSHNLWKLADQKSGSKKYDYKYETTGVRGQTTFIRLTSAWLSANRVSLWRGNK
ncbi:MAG: hypothetical protein IPK58_21565 [Acidobacteria bacterium]|nr:hypothetical protein [Acidobacteriota bacterium]